MILSPYDLAVGGMLNRSSLTHLPSIYVCNGDLFLEFTKQTVYSNQIMAVVWR